MRVMPISFELKRQAIRRPFQFAAVTKLMHDTNLHTLHHCKYVSFLIR